MDFFGAQDDARRSTRFLVVAFMLSVLAIVVVMYVLVDLGLNVQQGIETGAIARATWVLPGGVRVDPVLFGNVAAVVGGFILVTALIKTIMLRSGGGTRVAIGLGGRPVFRSSADPKTKVLLNIVDEMAIASGTPPPRVFVIPDEQTINAFAAGYSESDAVIGVTQGAIDTLSRDELQGVIAHEFSHILNGDMRLNMRIMGIVFGIAALGFIGRSLIYSTFYRRGGDARGHAAALGIGLALVVIGFVGVLLGNLIRAAISRQREFLADASAVQYTRNPTGIGGALIKLAKTGGQISSPKAAECGHLLFEEGVSRNLANPMASHPPIKERIKRVLPQWEPGAEIPAQESTEEATAEQEHSGFAPQAAQAAATTAPADVAAQSDATAPTVAVAAPSLPVSDITLGGRQATIAIGKLSGQAQDMAAAFMASLDPSVLDAADDPYGARAVIYSLLLNHGDDGVKERQLRHLADNADSGVVPIIAHIEPLVAGVDRTWRLSLAELCIPALRQLSPRQFARFDECLASIIEADGKVETFEWCTRTLVHEQLVASLGQDDHYKRVPKHDAKRYALSMLARSGGADAAAAFGEAMVELGERLEFVDEDPDREGLRAAFFRLRKLAPDHKRKLVAAAAVCVSRDGKASLDAFELFRVFALLLGCPAPPVFAAS